jgi:5'-nucleotidase
MMDRRAFIRTVVFGSTTLGLLSAQTGNKTEKLTILHTNDTHSHIDKFPSNHSKYPNAGGVNARKKIIDRVRSQSDHVLLLDAGDIFQGTPYFNMFGGKVELETMSAMGYDAATMGNHDFDGGLDGFQSALQYANFPFICSNYNFSETILKGKTIPYKIIRKGQIKIGILGIGVELEGLVSKSMYQNTQYLDPFKQAQKYANYLRNERHCNLVICLSHLGFSQKNGIDDIHLAKSTANIDVIIGGHTHTFLDNALVYKNSQGKNVIINQVGWAGLQLGKIELTFTKTKINDNWTHFNTGKNISV